MSIKLTITLIIASIFLITMVTYFLIKGRIPEKYALLWYAFSICIIIINFFPRLFSDLAKILGFELLSNMLLVVLIGILFFLVIALTIMVAGQKKKTILLIQEISILKKEVKNGKRK